MRSVTLTAGAWLLVQNIQFTENLKALADEWGCTSCQLALAWLHAQVSNASCGACVSICCNACMHGKSRPRPCVTL